MGSAVLFGIDRHSPGDRSVSFATGRIHSRREEDKECATESHITATALFVLRAACSTDRSCVGLGCDVQASQHVGGDLTRATKGSK